MFADSRVVIADYFFKFFSHSIAFLLRSHLVHFRLVHFFL